MFDRRGEVLEALGGGFRGQRVLVVGDVMLDRYLWGEVTRISPEAPVPVVRVVRESEGCGGAANVALNLARLEIRPALAGLLGADDDGQRLAALLERAGVEVEGLTPAEDRPTITKTRVVGGHQQMLRLDREALEPPPARALEGMLAAALRRLEADTAVLILSDYAKGVLDETVCQRLIAAARRLGLPVLVDPKGSDFRKYRGATALSPNRQELAAATRVPVHDLDALLQAAQGMVRELDLAFLAVTLSEKGIALVEREGVRMIPATAQEVFDVSGAGDTVIATLAAGLAAGLERLDALRLANLAAGVVVGKVGTTPIELRELLGAVTAGEALEQSAKLCDLEGAERRVKEWRRRGERIVFTNGCFDLLHAGHVSYLERARRLGGRLVVGLNTDASVRRLKGPSRPVIHEEDRARVLAALVAVDLVLLFDEETPLRLIRQLRPDVLAKGADYREDQVVGGAEVKSWGGQVALVPLVEGRSSSDIVARVRAAEGTPDAPSPAP
ncbi:MAG: bifunctional D-glycero-beta-D-manno-heptose-7-phosphate kinase/D-glycero-beta-D-manno-heptose 1-phosphate adenylyltransferase HldE [Magnetococcales bacterium]|nr:bifunctional D-glycero-beta-D-manno-heptose-7-phosphate kinase/D-glycero-beta-D-manno-heptose 1-phosphate adenylyltransferase HldE [Magnetococcales bacterium]